MCFFRAAPRIVRSASQGPTSSRPSHLLQSPATVSDAIRHLGLTSTDRSHFFRERKSAERRVDDSQRILRVMTNLFTHFPRKAPLDSKPIGDKTNYSFRTLRRSVVYIIGTEDVTADRMVAAEYVFDGTVTGVCEQNAAVARRHGRFDQERIFKMFQALIPDQSRKHSPHTPGIQTSLIRKLAMRLYVVLPIVMNVVSHCIK